MRAACGWERGRSGQGKYNEEASGSWVVNTWGIGRSRPARDADKQYICGRGAWACSGAESIARGSGRGRLKNTSLGFRGDGQTTEPNVQLTLFGCKSSKMRDTTGIRTTAHSVLLFKSPLIPKEGATWSLSELKVGNFRNFAPPIHVLMWPVLRPNTNSEERHFTKLLVFS